MKKEKNEKQKKSMFNLVSKILIIILCVVIVVQICIIIAIKVNHDNLERENGKIPTINSIVVTKSIDEKQDILFKTINF